MLSQECPLCHNDTLEEGFEKISCTNCIYGKKLSLSVRLKKWVADKTAVWRLLPLAFLLFTAFKYVADYGYPIERYANIISLIDLGIHEVGHILFSFGGRLITLMGGSIFQLLVPIIAIIGFYRQRYFFASTSAFIWLGLNFYDVASYAADARARNLPLVSIGGGSYEQSHDWYQILSRMDALAADQTIAFVLRAMGLISILIGLLASAYLLYLMLQRKSKPNTESPYKIFK